MNVCTQCGKENIPVIPPSDKCPHEYEIELQAADALAEALEWVCVEYERGERKGYQAKISSEIDEEARQALAAYEKVRGGGE